MNFKVLVERTCKRNVGVPDDFFFKFLFTISDVNSFSIFCAFLLMSLEQGEDIRAISVIVE